MDKKWEGEGNKNTLSTFRSDVQRDPGTYSSSRGVKIVIDETTKIMSFAGVTPAPAAKAKTAPAKAAEAPTPAAEPPVETKEEPPAPAPKAKGKKK
jgi:hypothetical protein